VDA
jgi:hypothetical protein